MARTLPWEYDYLFPWFPRPNNDSLNSFIATEHERNCLHPQKSGHEVMFALEAHDVLIKEEKKMFNTLIDLLSYEKIIFNGE